MGLTECFGSRILTTSLWFSTAISIRGRLVLVLPVICDPTIGRLLVKLHHLEEILSNIDYDAIVIGIAPEHFAFPEGALGHQCVEASEELGVHLEGLVSFG